MKVEELRIGNYIKTDGVVVKVDGRTIFDFWCYEERRRKHDPIPLTEEWLLKFGFQVYPNGDYEKYDFAVRKRGSWFSPIWKYTETGWSELKMIKIKYVHQLQNLFFSLVGEELETKKQSIKH